MTLTEQLAKYADRGVAASIRIVTTFNPDATAADLVAAGASLGLNAATIKKQFSVARKEDAEIERLCADLPRFI